MSWVKFVEASVHHDERTAMDLFSHQWSKLASSSSIYVPPAVEEFLKTAQPIPGHRLLLLHGMGSSEYWGKNANGDAFSEYYDGKKNLIEDDPSTDFGYHTFAKSAHVFRDHKNHDPRLTIGGRVKLAAWNDRLHRVELVVPISEKLAPDVVRAIDRDDKIACSMGCKVAYDVCSICGNKAKHRGEYCKHAAYQMGEILDDGRQVYVDNPQPKFFDISILGEGGQGRPADRSSYSLMKVAHAEVRVYRAATLEKTAASSKRSVHEKRMPAIAESGEAKGTALKLEEMFELIKKLVPHDLDHGDSMPRSMVIRICRLAPPKSTKAAAIVPTLCAAGIVLRPSEHAAIFGSDRCLPVDFDKTSQALFRELEPVLHARSSWLSFFGDRVLRNHKLATAHRPEHPTRENRAAYAHYLQVVQTALTETSLSKLAAWLDDHPTQKAMLVRYDTADLLKFGASERGLSASNLIAAMLGPIILSAYFRSKQMSGEHVGPIRGFVAEHPLMTGAATALAWHKLKGGKIPFLQG